MRRLRLFPPVLILIVFLALALPAPAAAGGTACPPESSASGSVTVEERSADITILSNGDVRYVETWAVNFLGTGFRFAFRTIPLNKAADIVDWSVSESGVAYENSGRGEYVYRVSRGLQERTIHWCFPPTSNQVRTFTLSYTVEGSLGIYEGGDRYFWKFIEADRGYAIMRSNVRIHLPADVAPDQLQLAGYINGRESLLIQAGGPGSAPLMGESSARILDSRTIEFSGGPFYGGTEWEIGVRFPHGLVRAEPQTWQLIEDNAPFFALGVMFMTGVLLLAGGLGIYLFWYTRGRDKQYALRAEFIPAPPEDVPPGVIGVLVDEMADMEDITATLVDLARRGYLRIVEMDKPRFGKKSDFSFIRGEADESALLPYEKQFLKALFGNRKERKLSNLKEKFYTSLPEIKKLMYEEVTRRGYFMGNPEKVRQKFGCTGFLMAAAAGFAAWGTYQLASMVTVSGLAFCLSASLMVFPVGLMIAARYMPRKSEQGARAAAQWEAFKRYLDGVDRYTKVEEAKDQFDRYLPYAIAFGLEKGWVKKFTPTDVPVPVWYQPYYGDIGGEGGGSRRGVGRPASVGGGAPSLDDAAGRVFGGLESMSSGLFTMLDQAASTFVSAPASSGSGGGGGFSGGGGGGGGSSGFG